MRRVRPRPRKLSTAPPASARPYTERTATALLPFSQWQHAVRLNDDSHDTVQMLAMVEQIAGDAWIAERGFPLETAPRLFVEQAATLLAAATHSLIKIEGDSPKSARLRSEAVFATVRWERDCHPEATVRSAFYVRVAARYDCLVEFLRALEAAVQDQTLRSVTWVYSEGHGSNEAHLLLPPPDPIDDAMCPWFAEGVDQFIDDYLDGTASILLLWGPTGSGKSSFVRYLMHRGAMDARLTYEEELLSRDALFVNFLTDDNPGVLVIEDADLMLDSRDLGNKMVSRLLNVSDGLIKLDDKKIVFTTNISDFSKIDPALIRPGRCFAVVNFRALTYPETIRACEAAKLPVPIEPRDYTLAELFNRDTTTPTLRRLGF